MLFTIYKEIQIGFGKLLDQYKQKTDKIRNMTIFEKISGIPEISGKLASLMLELLKLDNPSLCTHFYQERKGTISKPYNLCHQRLKTLFKQEFNTFHTTLLFSFYNP